MFEFLIHVAIMACLYGLLALSLNLQVGFGGLVNFGQVILFGCGTYGASIAFSNQLGPVAGIALGVIFALVVAVAFARLGRNLGADYWGIATLAVAEVLRILANNEAWLTGGAQGVGGIPLNFRVPGTRKRAGKPARFFVPASLLVEDGRGGASDFAVPVQVDVCRSSR